jgi:hypothetical protein
MHFVHLYFLPEHFTQRAVQEFDREPRELTLADCTYFEDAQSRACVSHSPMKTGRTPMAGCEPMKPHIRC